MGKFGSFLLRVGRAILTKCSFFRFYDARRFFMLIGVNLPVYPGCSLVVTIGVHRPDFVPLDGTESE